MKRLIITSSVLLIVLIILIVFSMNRTDDAVNQLGGGQESRFNTIDDLTSLATSTSAINPVKVLTLDANRRYALFQNNTAVDIWLYATTTALTSLPLANTDGILLEAKKAGAPISTFEISPNNMIYGHIYASSTAAATIIVNYK